MMGTGKTPGLLCICQICICGRHRCVHHPKVETKPKGRCVLTEYKDTYRQFPSYEPVRSIKPDSATRLSEQPFRTDTSYKHDYVAHVLNPHPRREQAKFAKPVGKVDGTSSYQYDYVEKFAPKMPSARPMYRPATANRPFSDTTVHRETYRPWELSVNKAIKQPSAIKFPTGKFNHQTTFQDDFKGHKGHHGREAIRIPEPALSIEPGKFANETTTRSDYTAKDARPVKSARPMQNVVRHAGPFNYKTTCQNAFKWPDGRPASSCKPFEMTYVSTEPLDCDTTHNMTYKAWTVPKRLGWKPRNGWSAPIDPFDHKTTFQHDYDGKHAAPAKSMRPDYHKIHPGEFDGVTTHKNEFKSWEVAPRESFRPMVSYKQPCEKFNGQTTFQTDFKAAKSPRPDLCIPKEGGFMFNGDQNFRTMYRDTYLGERPPTCPVKYVDIRKSAPSINGYVYAMDQNGHQLFAQGGADKSLGGLPVVQPSVRASVEVIG